MYEHLKRQGYDKKYLYPGIYAISVDAHIVYIGKSMNMLKRVAEHYVGIKKRSEHKYQVLADTQQCGHRIGFDVLYYASSQNSKDIFEEIGEMEGEFIRKYRPALNYQIPKESDWRSFDTNYKAKTLTASELLEAINQAGGNS